MVLGPAHFHSSSDEELHYPVPADFLFAVRQAVEGGGLSSLVLHSGNLTVLHPHAEG